MPVMSTAPVPGVTWTGAAARMRDEDGRTPAPSAIGLPEDVLALFEAAVEHRLDRLFHEPHLLFDDRIVVVRISREAHGVAEPYPVLGGKRQLAAREQ